MGRVFFTWYINTACNYRCSYCKPEQLAGRQAPAERWVEVWADIHRRYGSCHISFSGGEPFVYPGFIEILAGVTRHHTVEVITNLSCDVRRLVEKVNLKRLRLGASFHPECVDIEEFLGRVKELHKYDFEKWVTFVAYPPHLDRILHFQKRVQDAGVRFSILPFNGAWDGRTYPQGYTEAEKKVILQACGDDEPNLRSFKWGNGGKAEDGPAAAKSSTTKGRPCLMGKSYARIYPDGSAKRCCAPGAAELGNLIEGTFRLQEEPAPCASERCPCWKCMIPGEEERWERFWITPYRKT
ncbi:MAG: radical SAM protein [Elusimicrobia bacterium]|nr:radical SAM protein [Elusimicrobiota bacterium]